MMGPKRSPAQGYKRGRLAGVQATNEAPSQNTHRQHSGYLDPGSLAMAFSRSENKGVTRNLSPDRLLSAPMRHLSLDPVGAHPLRPAADLSAPRSSSLPRSSPA